MVVSKTEILVSKSKEFKEEVRSVTAFLNSSLSPSTTKVSKESISVI